MIRYFYIAILLPISLLGQVDMDTIFLWDNDYGKHNQLFPVVGAGATLGCLAWQDARWNDFDIYRQILKWNGDTVGINTKVSPDTHCNYQQVYVDAEGNPVTRVVFVWEDSLYKPQSNPTEIWARIYTYAPFRIYAGTRSQKRPSVSCRNNGDFVVSFTDYDPGTYPRIRWRRYSSGGTYQNQGISSPADSLTHHIPVSRVAYCDSGFVVVYDDSSRDGTQRSIYVQYLNVDGTIILNRQMISNSGASNEDYPAVAVNQHGFGVIVWQYWYSPTDIDIYARTFQMKPGSGTITFGSIVTIDITAYNSRNPRVTVFPNNDYFVVWEEGIYPRSGYDILGRACIADSLKNKIFISIDTLDQYHPDVESRNTDTCFVVWQSEEIKPLNIAGTYYNVYCRAYNRTNDGVFPYIPGTFIVTPGDTVGGRKGWYFDDENYDNPSTPDWNEDPIDEPDSAFVNLEEAILDQIAELNTNNQYYVVCAETLPPRQKGISDYDAVFLNLGFRTDDASAGVITPVEQSTLISFINSRHPTMVEGNDFGEMYHATTLFSKYKANYLGPGAPYQQGNIDTLYGVTGTSFKDLTLKYDYKDWVDNYVDSISPRSGYELILRSSGAPGKWMTGRTVGYGCYWKGGGRPVQDSFTVYCTFMLSGIKSNTHPNTYAEVYRRFLGYLGLNCQPEPITTLTAATGSSEGRITITWRVVSDDNPSESAEGPYKLKFARKKMTSESAFNDSSETYYQTWNTADSAVGKLITQNLFGLPPMDTLIFALKVSDESGLWNALGDEPRAIVAGDSVTPHTIIFGINYVKDFSNRYEFIDRRRKNDTGTDYDSLFVTWDYPYSPPWFELGFARCNFNTEGDLFIYVDTKSGGADSTVPYNGTSGRSGFFKSPTDSFRPDYCLIVENATTRAYKRWVPSKEGRGSWVDTTFSGGVVEDNIVNGYLYTELYIPYPNMGYTAGNPFKLVVLVCDETSNSIINAFPIFNLLGTYRNITQYYWWGSDGLTNGKVPARRITIGIEEITKSEPEIKNSILTVCPNPFTGKTKILLPSTDLPGRDASLKIYDITGSLIKSFNLANYHSLLAISISWDGTDDTGRTIPQGIYFCKFATPEKSEVVKIIYLK